MEEREQQFSFKNEGVIHILGLSMERDDMHCFPLVMVYGFSSNKVLYSRSN